MKPEIVVAITALCVAVVVFALLSGSESFEPSFRFALTGEGVLLSDDLLRVDLKWGPLKDTPYRLDILSSPIYSSMSGVDVAAGGATSFQLSRSQAPKAALLRVTLAAVDRQDNVIAAESIAVPNPFFQPEFPIPVFDFALPIVQCASDAVIVPDVL